MRKYIEEKKLIVILRGLTLEQALQTAQSLYHAGVRLVEYAYDGREADEQNANVLAGLCEAFNGRLHIGAGTVTSLKRLDLAARAGAKYIISPDTNPNIIKETVRRGLVSIPGALTPTEICNAVNAGADFVKLFPISAMYPHYLRDICAPLGTIPLLAVGGVNLDNCNFYLAQGCAGVCIGSQLVVKDWIQSGQYNRIESLARQYVEAVARGGCK